MHTTCLSPGASKNLLPECCKRRLNQALFVLCLIPVFFCVCSAVFFFGSATCVFGCFTFFPCFVFWLVLVRLSVQTTVQVTDWKNSSTNWPLQPIMTGVNSNSSIILTFTHYSSRTFVFWFKAIFPRVKCTLKMQTTETEMSCDTVSTEQN